jgi:hypothetical protein
MSQMLKLMRGTALVAGLLALTAMESCSKIPIPEPQLEGVYGLELKQDTRRAALYKGLETRLWIHMVWLKPDLVAAQAAQLSLMRAEPPDVASARKEKMLAESAAPTFFAIVYTPIANWNDFDAKNSVWRIALEGGRLGEATPVKVTRYDGPFNAELMALYPYVDDFSTAYRIQFPPDSMGEKPKVLLAGTLGKVELDWAAE